MNKECVCKNLACPRHGKCDECRANHHSNPNSPLTSCERLAQANEEEK